MVIYVNFLKEIFRSGIFGVYLTINALSRGQFSLVVRRNAFPSIFSIISYKEAKVTDK